MTLETPERTSDAPLSTATKTRSPAAPEVDEVCFGLLDAFSGAGLAFMSFVACIPGLLPAVILTALLLAPLVIPPVLVGGAAWLAYRALRIAAALSARALALLSGESARSREPGGRVIGMGA
jgi:hypothetical protein